MIMGKVSATPAKSDRWPAVVNDGEVLALWKLGYDTFEIAEKLWFHEAQVASRLAWLRDRGAK